MSRTPASSIQQTIYWVIGWVIVGCQCYQISWQLLSGHTDNQYKNFVWHPGPQRRVSGTSAPGTPYHSFHDTLNFNCSTSVQDPSVQDLRGSVFAKAITIAIFFLGEKCLTNNEGPAKNKECKFPWRYNGVMRDGCTAETVSDGRFVGFFRFFAHFKELVCK